MRERSARYVSAACGMRALLADVIAACSRNAPQEHVTPAARPFPLRLLFLQVPPVPSPQISAFWNTATGEFLDVLGFRGSGPWGRRVAWGPRAPGAIVQPRATPNALRFRPLEGVLGPQGHV